MINYSISRIARACGLSRSTLLYYDRLGLLRASGRTGSGYRYYTQKDLKLLKRICHFRTAGLSLKEIRDVLSSGGKPKAKLLKRRLRETAAIILELKNQQKLLARMLHRAASAQLPASVDKKLWVEMLRAAGMDGDAMNRWHAEFERRAPDGHNEFLLSLGIPEPEVIRIRSLSRGEAAELVRGEA